MARLCASGSRSSEKSIRQRIELPKQGHGLWPRIRNRGRLPNRKGFDRALREYAAGNPPATVECPTFFVNRLAKPINEVTLSKSFQRLRRIAGICRNDGGCYQPRIHDLRHTFAVHRLTAWYKQGLDVQSMLPALSAYMGFVCLDAADRYLRLTPERLRKQLLKLSPRRNGASVETN